MASRPSPLRVLAWTLGGFAVGALSWNLWTTRREATLQGWLDQGLDWLLLDRLARRFAWDAATLGAAAGCAAGLAGEALVRWRRTRADTALPDRPRSARGALAVAAGLLVLAFLGPHWLARAMRPTPPPGAPDVLLVLVDTWRADHAGFLGCERDVTPNLDRLTRSGVVFERAEAQASWTKPSVATLLTGLMPSRHGAVSEPLPPPARGADLRPGVTTLLEVLRARGWETATWSNNPHILPARGFGQGSARFFDYVHHPERTFEVDPGIAARMLADVTRWLDTERDPRRPFCAYVHLLDPHAPYGAPPEFQGRFARAGADELERLIAAYDEEILSVDDALGPFLTAVLRERPGAVVVLCSDHGEEFLDHGGRGHGHGLHGELTRVPLVLWAPGLAGARVPTQVRLMDVFPTVLELTGNGELASPLVQGRSLVPVALGEETEDRLAPAENGGDGAPTPQWRSISDGRLKLLRREAEPGAVGSTGSSSDADAVDAQLFDLVRDPGEQRDVHGARSAEAEALFETMVRCGWYVPPAELLGRLPRSTVGGGSDSALLRHLGYGGS